ncbi:VanZ family protein [Nitrosomonas ureae]|uniref:VanZ like family protein n=1 Tax=Nitrosomonas ureae TaxID=44577 RepID=A0A1H9C1A6_9PROT|nr:VanZ family protein [Nitrosomonas ureae]SEP95046.1 VanZ like family protein [Nitrosomonas ureae]
MSLFKIQCWLFILLAGTTITSHTWIPPYEQNGSELLTSHWQYKVLGNSQVDLTSTGFTLFSNNATTITSIYQNIPEVTPGTILLLSADVKCNDVIAGEKPWNQARLLLLQADEKKERWDLATVIVSLTGTHDWKNYQGIFTVSPETQSIRIIAQLSQATGSLQVNNIKLYPVRETRMFTMTRNITLSAWGIFFLLLTGSWLFNNKHSIFMRLLLVCTFISIIAGTTFPGDTKNQVSDEVKTHFHTQSESPKATILWDLSKIWHFCSFLLLGLIIALMMTQEPLSRVIFIVFSLGAGTELAQLYIEGRTPLVTDFFIDAIGGIIGIILINIFYIRHNSDKPSY